MTVSRLEGPAGTYFSRGLRPPLSLRDLRTNGNRLSEKIDADFSAKCFSTSDFREIRDLTGSRANAREQRQSVGTHGQVLIIHENMLKE
ncbi:hypothetical protein Mesau_05152 [Mesorhizobium australicum WSM2073]|uniref:Uncharacterized protein n=1 Tax=Mesorhizobium australicum (strain HAMBI 3006 / LMG 24608 / WSM2073) TaxID=754035 RepID=L0KPW4_MESAW|nr:hypothetical protein Mesau_05152 [Mesorhizobium australicum WSM2073]